jgi:hypothetical protein
MTKVEIRMYVAGMSDVSRNPERIWAHGLLLKNYGRFNEFFTQSKTFPKNLTRNFDLKCCLQIYLSELTLKGN